MKILLLLSVFIIFSSCNPSRKLQHNLQIEFKDIYTIPYNSIYNGTRIGGLSGIDHDPFNDIYYLISDDPSLHNPARFYTARIQMKDGLIDTVIFTSVNYLKQNDGSPFPGKTKEAPDPESIRLVPGRSELAWTSEGERWEMKDSFILTDPSVNLMNLAGTSIGQFNIPANMKMQKDKKGPRKNGVFEGACFSDDGKYLYINLEEPLFEDGPRAGLYDSTAWIRIIRFDVASRQPVAQFAYTLDPVAFEPIPVDAFRVNGVSEIMWVSEDQLLVIERSYSTGRSSNTIKIYLADLEKAENISNNASLQMIKPKKPVRKKLLLNLDDLGIHVDNIEGICYGPALPGGGKSLILVSDNNFSPLQETQFMVFEIK